MKITPSIEISIRGGNAERFFNMCSHHSIVFHHIYMIGDIYYATMNPIYFYMLKSLAKKSEVKLKIISKKGITFWLAKAKFKKILLLFPCICLFLLWNSSHYLWNVKLMGNSTLTTDMIGDYLKEQGLHFGMPLSEIPIKNIKNGLIDTYPQINWASVMLDGTTLKILINESQDLFPSSDYDYPNQDLRAPISGIIESVLVRNGTLLVEEGMEVQKGDVLISSHVPIFIEHTNEEKNNNYVADGDITIIANYPIDEELELNYITPVYTKRSTTKIQFLWKDKSYLLPTSHIPYSCYDVYSEEIEHPIINIFSLPLGIKRLTFQEYYPTQSLFSIEEAKINLQKRLNQIITSLEEKGVQIIEKNVKIESNSVSCRLSGYLQIRVICNKDGILEDYP